MAGDRHRAYRVTDTPALHRRTRGRPAGVEPVLRGRAAPIWGGHIVGAAGDDQEPGAPSCASAGDLISALNWFNLPLPARAEGHIAFDHALKGGHIAALVPRLRRRHGACLDARGARDAGAVAARISKA